MFIVEHSRWRNINLVNQAIPLHYLEKLRAN